MAMGETCLVECPLCRGTAQALFDPAAHMLSPPTLGAAEWRLSCRLCCGTGVVDPELNTMYWLLCEMPSGRIATELVEDLLIKYTSALCMT